MSELYSIKSETLTGICDVLRSELGETRLETVTVPLTTYVDQNGASVYTVISIPNATNIHVDITYQTTGFGTLGFYQIAPGALDSMPEDAIKLTNIAQTTESLTFENTDTITIYNVKPALFGTNSANANIYATDAAGNYVEFEGSTVADTTRKVKNTFKSNEIAPNMQDIVTAKQSTIEELENSKLPDEALLITGDCSYRFTLGGWDWFIKKLGTKVTTEDITKMVEMFTSSSVSSIPFDLNCKAGNEIDCGKLFMGCAALKEVPKINNCKPFKTDYIFNKCEYLREIPEDIGSWFNWSYIDTTSGTYSGNRSYMFTECRSLRRIPMSFLEHGNPTAAYSYSIYNNLAKGCFVLDEIVDMPNPHKNATWTSDTFAYTFDNCQRLKNLTFKMPNGVPYVVNWKGQTIDLTKAVGYCGTTNNVTSGNTGITLSKQVKDATTYAALKNDPDWFTTDVAYSRYNHDSAVATINSLPDTSAYLATAGGTNTIKFKGAAGSKTDGGAINTLTEEEIAVATAKGWTVTFV